MITLFSRLTGAASGIIITLGLLVAVPARAEELMTIVDDYLAAWNAHDAAKAASFLAEDAEYYDASVGTPQKGRQAAQDNVIQAFITAVPDCVWTRDSDPVVGADSVAFSWKFKGTNTGAWADGTAATGKSFEFPGATIMRFKDGKIVWQGDYYDAYGFYKQIGLAQ